MKQRIAWRPADTLPDRREVLLLQGIPDGVDPSPRLLSIVESATALYLEAAEPRALVADISQEAFAEVYRGDGDNAPVTPVEAIVPRADALALYVATVGARVTDRIRTLFAQNEPALATMLDAVASAAADRLTHLLAVGHGAGTGGANGRGRLTLGYSPGYCGWHVSGQAALFRRLEPERIGVRLTGGGFMRPEKSVSGVILAGPRRIHRFPPTYPFCAACETRACRARIAALSGRGAREARGAHA